MQVPLEIAFHNLDSKPWAEKEIRARVDKLEKIGPEAVVETLAAERFDVLFLPINGRNPSRGVAGNMSVVEAVELATVARPRFVVPHHYDMFTFNTVPVADFEAEARRPPAGTEARVLQCGPRWALTP